ncbi:hypothetical protein N7475_002643 [Penicillium sp. IBT 31633x]|nr:hypothetical protein N7475_002643 [Penicillium sp. IBT 31633x]
MAPSSSVYFPYSPSFPSPSTETTSLPIAYSLLFFRTKKPESNSSEDNIITANSSDLERDDAIYETDLIELEDVSSLRKYLRFDDNLTLEPEVSFNARELYKDLLDKGGVNLSEIPKDFDKVLGTIKRRERIKIIYIISYASVSSSSELTKIIIKDKDGLEIRRSYLARFADRKGYFTPISSGIEVVKCLTRAPPYLS